MPVQVTCFGGVREVGGNKILLEDGERRLLFDFGKSFGRYGAFFDGVFIKERTARGLLDPISLGLIPPLRGLLREDLIPGVGPSDLEAHGASRARARLSPQTLSSFWEQWERRFAGEYRDLRRAHAPAVDLILLSHAHQDHISDLAYVSAEPPVASSRATAFIGKVLLDVGQTPMGGAPYLAPRGPTPEGVLQSLRDQSFEARPYHMFGGCPQGRPTGDPLADEASFWSYAGSKGLAPIAGELPAGLSIRHWRVDHSIPGATAYAVETEAGWVAYTGDLRFHGALGDSAWKLADDLAALQPAVLLCEGTRLGDPKVTREEAVLGNCLEAVRRSQGRLVVGDFAPRNVERLLTFLRIAGETGRRLLVQPKDAYLLRAMHLADSSASDAMQDPRLGLYRDPKLTEREWEAHVRERYRARTVSPAEVRREPGAFILAFSLTDVADLLDIDYLIGAKPGGAYIFSNSPAYDDEQMVDLVRLWNWVGRLGMELVGLEPVYSTDRREVTRVVPVPGFHASGHASEEHLLRFAQMVRPKRLVAIHTESPSRWLPLLEGSGIEVVAPERGEPIRM